ncbi:MAG: YceD family protein, partial [Rhodospirillaceae bacterium]
LEELAAELTLQPDDTDGTVRAVGHLTARYTQPCSVTLEPLTSTVEVPVDITYAPEEDLGNQSDDESDLDLDEPPEPIVDGVFDVGETLVQLLALEIDPFPRTPDLPFEDFTDAGDPGPAASPFAALADLKKKLDNP